MKQRRIVCLLLSLIVMMAMSTTTADAASFKSKPTGVKAKCVSGVAVQVYCNKKKGATGYKFYYATKKSGKYKLGATSKTRTGTIKGLTPGKTYYFKVKAYKGKVLKKYTKLSKPVKCKAVLKAPGIACTDKCCCRIALKVTGSTGCKGYKIYRSTSKYGIYDKVGTITGHAWIDEGPNGKPRTELDPSTTYYYKVRSYSGSYHSPYSAPLAIKTKDAINGNHFKYLPGKDYSTLDPVPEAAPGNGNNKLTGRKILFLGSSITYGSATGGKSFADFIEARDGASVKKLAKSGTNMSNPKDGTSYVARLNNDDPYSFIPDIFVCQLSLNDSVNGIGVGTLPTIKFNELDESVLETLYSNATTVSGAIAYVDAYAHYYWPECQVVFYTVRNNGYNDQYANMREKLYAAKDKYGNFEIIDMWGIRALTDLKKNLSQFCLYMYDNNHPNLAGYLYQWTPEFEKAFNNWMPDMPEYFTVTWKNEDGTVLETDKNARYGERPSYNGKAPMKTGTEEYTYEFIGWVDTAGPDYLIYTPEALKNMKVEGNVTYMAVFDEKPVAPSEPSDPEDPGEVNNPDTNNIFNLPFFNPDTDVVDEPTDNDDEVDNGTDEGDGDRTKIEEEVLDLTGMIQSMLWAA